MKQIYVSLKKEYCNRFKFDVDKNYPIEGESINTDGGECFLIHNEIGQLICVYNRWCRNIFKKGSAETNDSKGENIISK